MSTELKALVFHIKWLLVFDLGSEPQLCLYAMADEDEEKHSVLEACCDILPSRLHIEMIWISNDNRLFTKAPEYLRNLICLLMKLIYCVRTFIILRSAHADVTLGRLGSICVRSFILKVAIN